MLKYFQMNNTKPFYLAVLVKHHKCFYYSLNTLSCPSKSNSKRIELTVHTSCYWGLKLTLCYKDSEIINQ